MSENPRQPRPDDAVLGGQSQIPMYAAVLGGIEGVKQRLETANLEEKKAALQDALKYGDKGIKLLFEILRNYEINEELWWLSHNLLDKKIDSAIDEQLQSINKNGNSKPYLIWGIINGCDL